MNGVPAAPAEAARPDHLPCGFADGVRVVVTDAADHDGDVRICPPGCCSLGDGGPLDGQPVEEVVAARATMSTVDPWRSTVDSRLDQYSVSR